MKKISFLLLLITLSACSKKSAAPVPDATVVYHVSGNIAASYELRYTGSNGQPVTTTFTGTEWSKTVIANKASGFTNAVLFISLTSPKTVINGSAYISVNNVIVNQEPLTFDSNFGSTDLTFGTFVFK
jgi:hypothetical protein